MNDSRLVGVSYPCGDCNRQLQAAPEPNGAPIAVRCPHCGAMDALTVTVKRGETLMDALTVTVKRGETLVVLDPESTMDVKP